MSILLDSIIIAIIAVTALIAAKKGFIRTVIEVAGFIAAIFIASALSAPISSAAYRAVIEKPLVNAVSASANTEAGNLTDQIWSSLPDFVSEHSEKLGLSYETLKQTLSGDAVTGVESAARAAADAFIKPVAVKILNSIFFFLIFIVLTFIIRFLAKLLNRLLSFSIVGSLNKTLGCILGAIKGIIYAFAVCSIIMVIITLSGGELWFINDKVILKSFLFRFFAQLTALYPLK